MPPCSRPSRDHRDDAPFPWGVVVWAAGLIGILAWFLLP